MTKHIVSGTCTTGGSSVSQIIRNRQWSVQLPGNDTAYVYEFFPTSRSGEEAPKLGMHRPNPSNGNDEEHLHASLTGVKVVFAYSHDRNSGRIYLDVPDSRIGYISRGPVDPGNGDYSTETMLEDEWKWLFSALFTGKLGAAGTDITPFNQFSGVVSDFQFAGITFSPDPKVGTLGSQVLVTITTKGDNAADVTSNLEFTPAGSPTNDGDLFDATLTKIDWKDASFPLRLKQDAQMAYSFYAEWPEDH